MKTTSSVAIKYVAKIKKALWRGLTACFSPMTFALGNQTNKGWAEEFIEFINFPPDVEFEWSNRAHLPLHSPFTIWILDGWMDGRMTNDSLKWD